VHGTMVARGVAEDIGAGDDAAVRDAIMDVGVMLRVDSGCEWRRWGH
jgi:hypothetical protein